MAKGTKDKSEEGEQMDLIEVHPKNQKKIISLARAYKKAQRARTEALAEEIKWKEKLLAEVKQGEIKPDPDGGYKFKLDGARITVTPRDELIRVKFEDDKSGDNGDDPTE